MDMLRSIGKQSGESVESVLKKKKKATVGPACIVLGYAVGPAVGRRRSTAVGVGRPAAASPQYGAQQQMRAVSRKREARDEEKADVGANLYLTFFL